MSGFLASAWLGVTFDTMEGVVGHPGSLADRDDCRLLEGPEADADIVRERGGGLSDHPQGQRLDLRRGLTP